MGTTLANLHIYYKYPDTIKPLIKDDHIITEISEGWTSILGVEFEETDKQAKALSKKTEAAVLSFMYFDDDLISLKVFKNGGKLAHYETYYEREPYLKNYEAFLSEFNIDAVQERRLRKILKCEDIGRKVEMLEELFGVALYVDAQLIKEGTEKYKRVRDDAHYLKYDEEQKRLNKIKNKTKAVLTQEIEGVLEPFFNKMGTDENYFMFSKTDEKRYLAELIGDILQPIAQKIILPEDNFIQLFHTSNEFLIKTPSFDGRHDQKLQRVAKDGTVLGEFRVTGFIGLILDNGDIVCIRGDHRYPDKIMGVDCFDNTGNIKWSVDTGNMYPYGVPIQQRADIFFGTCTAFVRNGLKSEFYKLSIDGSVILKKEFTRITFDPIIKYVNGYIFCKARDYSDGAYREIFVKMNESLEIVDRIIFPKGISIYGDGTFIEKISKACYSSLDGSLVSIDLKTMEYNTKKIVYEFSPQISDDEGNIYGYIGESSIGIFDDALNLISRHRLKGSISCICKTKMGIHAVTKTEKYPNLVRVYRIDPA